MAIFLSVLGSRFSVLGWEPVETARNAVSLFSVIGSRLGTSPRPPYKGGRKDMVGRSCHLPLWGGREGLLLGGVVGLYRFRLNDDGGVASLHVLTLRGDGSCHVAGCQSEGYRQAGQQG